MTEKEKALKEFTRNIEDIEEKLKLIKTHCIDNHMGIDLKDVDWSAVGNTDHAKEMLCELISFLDIK